AVARFFCVLHKLELLTGEALSDQEILSTGRCRPVVIVSQKPAPQVQTAHLAVPQILRRHALLQINHKLETQFLAGCGVAHVDCLCVRGRGHGDIGASLECAVAL
ncbi:hypothetical protein BaRGS_00031176, partial [Batillaria attramentaria]